MRSIAIACSLAFALGCGEGTSTPSGTDAGEASDAGRDAMSSVRDAGVDDAGDLDSGSEDAGAEFDPWCPAGECEAYVAPQLGARRHSSGDVEVRVEAPNATRVEVAFFDRAWGAPELLRVPLVREGSQHRGIVSAAALAGAGLGAETIYYGLRAWGPNWHFDPEWEPGSERGRVADVNGGGHRMNPNKLLLDPYSLEVSHDPIHADNTDYRWFLDGDHALLDSGPWAPKGIVIDVAEALPAGPARPLRDDIVYEVHLRGLTMQHPDVPEDIRGTYAGAATVAPYLAELGITAIEFLPLHETPNDQNELSPDASGDNYWGYSTLSYFAPDRRYAADRSPGGPTREFRAMVEAFHAEGIKVFVDVVYNHTTEGGLLSWRGLDNATFYEVGADATRYVNGNGVGPNLNTANPVVQELVLSSLGYWHHVLGVDGYRFDLASIVGNGCTRSCYFFDREGILRRAEDVFGRSRFGGPGVDLIAEPWGLAAGSYQLGNYPGNWAEWNDQYRDTLRRDLSSVGTVTPRELAQRFEGSPSLFASRGPATSVNFVVAHDGFTLADLFRYDTKVNGQAWPWGPSDGGSDNNYSTSYEGNVAIQRSAARTALAMLMLSAGTPMITGGDEMLRTQRGNNNAYNLDNSAIWLDWGLRERESAHLAFARRLMNFRRGHPALRPTYHWAAAQDDDEDGYPQVRWLRDDGTQIDDDYFDDEGRHFVGYLLDGDELGDEAPFLYVAYNGWEHALNVSLPALPDGRRWTLRVDTSPGGDPYGHFAEPARSVGEVYTLGGRGLGLFVAE